MHLFYYKSDIDVLHCAAYIITGLLYDYGYNDFKMSTYVNHYKAYI